MSPAPLHWAAVAQTPAPVPQFAIVVAQQIDVPQSLVNEHVWMQMPPWQLPTLHWLPLQQAWPAPPHAAPIVHIPFMQISPCGQHVPLHTVVWHWFVGWKPNHGDEIAVLLQQSAAFLSVQSVSWLQDLGHDAAQ